MGVFSNRNCSYLRSIAELSFLGMGHSTSDTLFAALTTYKRKWKELNSPLLWKYAFFIALFNGVLYYTLYFIGLETTTPGNTAIIAQFEVFTSFLFFHVFRGERISLDYKIGGVLTVIGAGIILGRDFSSINPGIFSY